MFGEFWVHLGSVTGLLQKAMTWSGVVDEVSGTAVGEGC